LDLEAITEDAEVAVGRPIRYPYWMEEGWDGVVYFGHHSMARTDGGNLCHSWAHVSVVEVRLNEEPIGEIGWYIYTAGYFKTPAMLVTGDDKACAEAKRLAPEIETAVVKRGVNATTAICRPPCVAQDIIGRAAAQAMKRLVEMKPVAPPKPPLRVTCRYSEASMAENFCKGKRWAQRVDEFTVACESEDFADLSKKFL
jgi:D-amino peptidase